MVITVKKKLQRTDKEKSHTFLIRSGCDTGSIHFINRTSVFVQISFFQKLHHRLQGVTITMLKHCAVHH